MPTPKKSIPFGRPMLGDAERAAAAEVLGQTVLTHGPRCHDFEARFAKLIGVKHAITTSSCTTALHLSLMAVGVGAGDEVIVPAQTHVATAHVVEFCGAKPVFVDVDAQTGNIATVAVEAAITPRTKAIMVVHFLGLPCQMDSLCDLAKKHGLFVVEDCALALGATWAGHRPGSLGSTGCFSFYPSKHITTLEGGMLTTNNDGIAERARKFRAFGYDRGVAERSQPGVYDIVALGHNFRMSEVHAAIGICQLDRLAGFVETRLKNAERLLAGLAKIPGLTCLPLQAGQAKSSAYCVNAVLPRGQQLPRADIVARLSANGIGTSVHYPVALPLSTYYREKYHGAVAAFATADWIARNAISLPVGPHLTVDDMDFISKNLADAIEAIGDAGRRS